MAEPLVKWVEAIGCEEVPMVVSMKADVYKVEDPSKSKIATLTLLYFDGHMICSTPRSLRNAAQACGCHVFYFSTISYVKTPV